MSFKGTIVAAVMTASVVTIAGSAQAAAPAAPKSTQLYIVQMAGAPLASYTGGVAGLAATKPAAGSKVDLKSAQAKAYRQHLKAQHDRALKAAGVDAKQKAGDLDVVFNGFAAKLSGTQATKLARTEGVLAVIKDEVRKLDTISTPAFLGLEGSSGVWQKQFGGDANAGLGVIVGVIDTGFWPESPSFAPLSEPRPDQAIIDGKWSGTCDEGATNTVSCNNKVIGARYYNDAGLSESWESLSPRDDDSHGSHTASTAAGNHGVNAVINGVSVGTASGMAPAARIGVYKVCWAGGCGTFDSVNAIEDAIADGVDVLNYSISGSRTSVLDPVEVAFFNAAAAGVFVAASAGNSGPGATTVAHNSPWLTTVAASTHDRNFTKSVTLGNGATYTGVGAGPAVASTGLIDSVAAAKAGANPAEAELCFLGTLDPALVAGKIVLCKRGVNARVDKSLEVKNTGGVGMVLYNSPDSSLNADFHYVPTVHLQSANGLAIKAYAATAGATASLSAGTPSIGRAPNVASFSSAGPALSGDGDLLKPDITAPGVDVIAAVSPTGNNGNLYNALSGTSMSSPHIAGLAALVRSKHPTWSPIWVKSALMTTASQTDNTGAPIQRGAVNATPLDFGSGHVNSGRSFDPGLVYDSSYTDWIRFICGTGQLTDGTCDITGSIDPSDLNYPSIAVGDLPGTQTITRKVTNTSNHAVIYQAQVQAPPGTTVKVSPEALIIPKGQTASFTVKITRTSAAFGAYTFGSLTWKEFPGTNGPLGKRDHVVRSPIAVRPVQLGVPTAISGTGASGSVAVSAKAGYTGTLTAAPNGLVAATVTNLAITGTQPNFNQAAPAVGPGVGKVTVTVPAGSKLGRFSTFESDYLSGTDLDMFVYQAGTASQVGLSAGGTSEESVTLGAGSYDIYVVAFALAPGETGVTAKHNHWVVAPGSAGNFTATPASQAVTLGASATVTIGWSGLTAGVRYLGVVSYGNGTSEIASTVVSVTG
ncbi:S8 family peptidase [Catelliglobosispora koreensis]|uniref:S8 family peptidase n=1 Tax=Catelliglobosispora koreensis TaxID=129052 RepID=UPI000368CEAF|nr:S8 family peptidase [Catelliglobosispora koreensis]